MAKHNSKGRAKYARFIGVPHSVYQSPAFQNLHPYAVALYLAIRARFNGHNNGQIGFSISDACQALAPSPGKRASRATAVKFLRQLQQHGFIVCKTPGHKGTEGKGLAAEWRFTDEATASAPPTRDFAKWQRP